MILLCEIGYENKHLTVLVALASLGVTFQAGSLPQLCIWIASNISTMATHGPGFPL